MKGWAKILTMLNYTWVGKRCVQLGCKMAQCWLSLWSVHICSLENADNVLHHRATEDRIFCRKWKKTTRCITCFPDDFITCPINCRIHTSWVISTHFPDTPLGIHTSWVCMRKKYMHKEIQGSKTWLLIPSSEFHNIKSLHQFRGRCVFMWT